MELRFDRENGKIAGVQFTDDKILVIPVCFSENHAMSFKLDFYEDIENEPHRFADIAMGVMPDIEVDIIYALKNLSLKDLFIPRTPGRLKNMSTGTPTKAEKVNTFIFRIAKSAEKYTVTIGNPYLTDQMPESTIPQKPLVDKMGQWTRKDWPGKTKNESEMIENYRRYLSEALPPMRDGRSKYGGCPDKKFNATGFFHAVQEENGHFYLADPDGYAFFSLGVDCISANAAGVVKDIEGLFEDIPGEDGEYKDAWHKGQRRRNHADFCFLRRNLIRAFGENWYGAWSAITAKRLKHWGFNTVANWSDSKFAKENAIPYVTETPFPQAEINILGISPMYFQKNTKKTLKSAPATWKNLKMISI